jgi:hypothetical protein
MSEAYEEIVCGESLRRRAPGRRHELALERLHAAVSLCMAEAHASRLLPPRTVIELAPGTLVRPDLTLVTRATGKAWLLAEVIEASDHHPDTVTRKNLYEHLKLPRLWMVDPRHDSVEVYESSTCGLTLKRILAHRERLQEALLPGLQLAMVDLFGP